MGSKFSRHFVNHSEVKPKPIVACACTFSRTLCRLRVITSSFDWFTGLSPSFLIGQSNYFGFGFTTLYWNSLYRKELWKVNWSFDLQEWPVCKFSSHFQWNVSQTGIGNEGYCQVKRCDLDITPNSHDYPTKNSLALVGRMIVLIVGMDSEESFASLRLERQSWLTKD